MTAADERRLVLFEVGGGAYALPIADVLEVTEWSQLAAIPTLPAAVAGVINHHGDALPIVARDALLEEAATDTRPEHVLVLGVSGGQSGRLGVPVDRVLGLVDVPAGTARERRARGGTTTPARPHRGRARRCAPARTSRARDRTGRRQSMTVRVLVADDARFMRQLIRDIIEPEGFEVVGEAADGRAAVEEFTRLQPDSSRWTS